ncbi:flagellar protein FlgN [Desulfosarcina sp. OttesenSCG-928-G10]|nr:flagellar protein FlgN [Desulfosarcina sp. OttesenSCG-928-G10]
MNPDSSVTQLLALMDAEMAEYETMRTLLVREKELAFRSDRDGLTRLAGEKRDRVNALKQLEEKRLQAVFDIAGNAGIKMDPVRPLTATQLTRYLDPAAACELTDRAGQLKRLMEQVQTENNANAEQFSIYLGLIQDSLNMLSDLVYGHSVYTDPNAGNRPTGYGTHRGTVISGNI